MLYIKMLLDDLYVRPSKVEAMKKRREGKKTSEGTVEPTT